ncbi:MAG: nitrous oxide reductase accessory protein NosL [Sterolibacterium sp.]|jgi:copper chaperone NosL|nr:nitrous oxide reductase accessory protein NosL [Sterolibacterium sp.]
MKFAQRWIFVFLLGLGACGQTEQAPPVPQEIAQGTSCTLDGMLLADFPGPKAQIHYAQGAPEFFCDTVEMFSIYLRPEQQKKIRALYVQDMGKAVWNTPQGHWIDARTAVYIQGSKLRGSMGPTFVSFADETAARAFIGKNGGKLLRFSEITPEMSALDGGALHDQRM